MTTVYLLILYYGMHATSPGAAMLTGGLPVEACNDMAVIGRDASHVTTCGAGNTVSAVLALHHCTLVAVSNNGDMPEIRNYTCQE